MKTLMTAEQCENLGILTEWMDTLVDTYNMQQVKEALHADKLNTLAAELEDMRESLKCREAVIDELLNGFEAIRVMLGIDKDVDMMTALAKRLNYKQPDCGVKEESEVSEPAVYCFIVSEWHE